MYLKCITNSPYIGPDSITPHIIFDDVTNLRVADYWLDLGEGSHNIPRGETAEEFHDFCPGMAIGSGSTVGAPKLQQQHLFIYFESHGKKHEIVSTLPVYVMNEKGTTIQSYSPITK